jgi:hypothetical protein
MPRARAADSPERRAAGRVVMLAPFFDQYLRFTLGVEDLSVE